MVSVFHKQTNSEMELWHWQLHWVDRAHRTQRTTSSELGSTEILPYFFQLHCFTSFWHSLKRFGLSLDHDEMLLSSMRLDYFGVGDHLGMAKVSPVRKDALLYALSKTLWLKSRGTKMLTDENFLVRGSTWLRQPLSREQWRSHRHFVSDQNDWKSFCTVRLCILFAGCCSVLCIFSPM